MNVSNNVHELTSASPGPQPSPSAEDLAMEASRLAYDAREWDALARFRGLARRTLDVMRRDGDGATLASVLLSIPEEGVQLAFLEAFGDALLE